MFWFSRLTEYAGYPGQLLGPMLVTSSGLGLLFVQSVAHRDYTLTQALVLLVAAIFIVVNFLMDLMYAWLDPRIRYR